MKPFLNADFLLETKTAILLYNDFAADMPIIDYHNHLPPQAIEKNEQFESITAAWLDGDHYKWRAMRANGVHEKYITGNASSLDKFREWAATVPYTMGNPLYHWTHLELQRYFGIGALLDANTADDIYAQTTDDLGQDSFRCRGLLEKMNVELICTTDDPVDTLEHHKTMMGKTPVMLPAFRPDKIFSISDTNHFNKYLQKLEKCADISIRSLDDLLDAIRLRIDYFDDHGCRISDHGLEQLYLPDAQSHSADKIFLKALNGQSVSPSEQQHFTMTVLRELCLLYHEKNWVQQFHLGALRNNSSRMLHSLGPDTGFDSMGDFPQAKALSAFLDDLDSTNQLARTILYNLNPGDNEMMATMAGNFNDGSTPGKVQFGSAWWFLDQKDGMEKQLTTLSNMGLLSRFVGMLTDSRSFLSYPRHEYFRRILCNQLGSQVESGLLPNDILWLGRMVQNICYYNAKEYFALNSFV